MRKGFLQELAVLLMMFATFVFMCLILYAMVRAVIEAYGQGSVFLFWTTVCALIVFVGGCILFFSVREKSEEIEDFYD